MTIAKSASTPSVALGADHGGYELKEQLKSWLRERGHPIRDLGTMSKEPVDYPKIAHEVAGLVASGACRFGIMVDGAGIGSAILASLAGYAMVHTNVKAPHAWFIGIFIGNLFPFQLFLIPLYFVLKALHLYDTRLGLVIAYMGICVPFALFVFRNYAYTLPAELFDAAKVDGASRWAAYTQIFLPMSRPAFAVVFCFQFIWTWNDLLFAMVLSEKYRPIMNTLGMLSGSRGSFPPPVILMGAVIASLPTVILLLSLQKTFIRGFTLTAEK